jgi:hypothetical protein
MDLSPTTVTVGAAKETAAMPRAVRQTIQEPPVSIVAQPDAPDRVTEEAVI